MKRSIHLTAGGNEGTPYTPAVEAGGFVFISGQIANVGTTRAMKNATITEEAEQVMDNLGAVLRAAGLGFDHLVKCTIHLTNLQYYAEVSRVYLARFTGDPPARETIAAKEMPRGANVQISGVAFRG
jgi:2-iminobutanoate/2-iminopropanoate deaminase